MVDNPVLERARSGGERSQKAVRSKVMTVSWLQGKWSGCDEGVDVVEEGVSGVLSLWMGCFVDLGLHLKVSSVVCAERAVRKVCCAAKPVEIHELVVFQARCGVVVWSHCCHLLVNQVGITIRCSTIIILCRQHAPHRPRQTFPQ